jgi:hypothetical protein
MQISANWQKIVEERPSFGLHGAARGIRTPDPIITNDGVASAPDRIAAHSHIRLHRLPRSQIWLQVRHYGFLMATRRSL